MSKLITEMYRIGMLEKTDVAQYVTGLADKFNKRNKRLSIEQEKIKKEREKRRKIRVAKGVQDQKGLVAQYKKQNDRIAAEKAKKKEARELRRKARVAKGVQNQKDLVAQYKKQNDRIATEKARKKAEREKRRKIRVAKGVQDQKDLVAQYKKQNDRIAATKANKNKPPEPPGMSTRTKVGIGAAGVAAGVGAWQLYKWWKKKRDSAKNAKERAKATASMNKAKARAKRVKEDVTLDDLKLFVNEYEILTKDDFEIVKEYINIIINGKQNTLAEEYLSRIN